MIMDDACSCAFEIVIQLFTVWFDAYKAPRRQGRKKILLSYYIVAWQIRTTYFAYGAHVTLLMLMLIKIHKHFKIYFVALSKVLMLVKKM